MFKRIGVCGVVLSLGLLVAVALAADPTEQQQQAKQNCEDAFDEAVLVQADCDGARLDAVNLQIVFNNRSKSHLTPGESTDVNATDADASESFSNATIYYNAANTDMANGITAQTLGDNRWGLQLYAAAMGYYIDAEEHFYLATQEFYTAKWDFEEAGAFWASAIDFCDEALIDPYCLLCTNPDAQCNCEE